MSVFALTWPIFIETLLRTMLGNVDTFMLSTYSDDAVGAVGVVSQISYILIMLYNVVSSGTLVLISQYLGAKKKKEASVVAVTSIAGSLIFGLFVGLAVFLFRSQILTFLNLPPELMGYAMTFLGIVGGFSFTQALIATLSAIIRSYGNTRITMYISVGMNILNIIGNSIFLYGLLGAPKMGVTGVAIATVISQAVGVVAMLIVMLTGLNQKFSFRDLVPLPWEILRDILKIGLPSAGEGIAYEASQLTITRIITVLGKVALTTRVYTLNIMYFVMVFSVAVGQGTQIVVGHLVGAGDNEKAYKTCIKSLRYAVVVAIILAGIVSFFSEQLLGIFTDDRAIIEMGSKLLLIAVILEPGRVFNIVIINSLRAAGDARFPVIMGIISMWGIGVLLSYFLGVACGLGLIGVWIAFASDEWFRGIAMLLRWRSRVWYKMALVKNQNIEMPA